MIAYYDKDGKYIWVGNETMRVEGAPPPPEHPMKSVAHGKYRGVVNQFTQYHDLQSNTSKNMPDKPAEDYSFDYVTKTWVPMVDRAWERVRSTRDQLLKQTDWYVTKATELGEPMVPAVVAYRQALRDITSQSDPYSIVWPVLAG